MRTVRTVLPGLEPSDRALLRIVIPAKNEASRIERTVTECCDYFGARAHVLVVLNGCTDATADVVRSLAARYPTLDVLEIASPIGKGGAVRAGLTLGSEPFVAFVDADGSTAARQIDMLLDQCVRAGAAGAIGSRWIAGAAIGRKQPWRRRVASRAFNLAVRGLFGLRFSDTQCGAKVFRREAIAEVFERLEVANFAFDVDVLFALRRAGYHVIEVPIVWADVPDDSKVHLVRAGTSMLAALLRLRVKHSPLRGIPFVDKLARAGMMPVRSGLELLVVVDRAAHFSLPPATYPVLRDLESHGHRVTVREIRGALDVARFHVWYARHAQLQFDAIVDGTAATSLPIVRLSSKPKIARADMLRFDHNGMRRAFDAIARACGYSAFIWRNENAWMLSESHDGGRRRVLRGSRDS